MRTEFYNYNLRKILYDSKQTELDFSCIKASLVENEYYVCKMDGNSNKVIGCYPLKSMQFEIRNIKESTLHNNTYSCSVRVLSYEDGREYPKTDNVVVVGYFYNAYPEAVYDTMGYWDIGRDGRDVFFVTERQQTISSSENSIIKYLSSLLKGKGIGKTTITKIVNKLGCDTLNKIRNNDPILATLVRKPEKRKAIIDAVQHSIDSERSLNFMIQNGIEAELAINITNKLGTTSLTQISENPYILLKFSNIPIETINLMAKKLNVEYHNDVNLDGLILRYINYRINTFGDIYVEHNDFYHHNNGNSKFELFYDRYNKYEPFTHDEISQSLNRLFQSNQIFIEKHVTNPDIRCIYTASYHNMENKVVATLKKLNNVKPSTYIEQSEVEQFIQSFEKNGLVLDSIQADAIIQAFKNKLSIISGGPGTGKTLVTKSIVDVFKKVFPDKKVQLCAPTGKASRRMSDVIGLPACTIHRKIGYGTGEDMPIEEDLLIIDECSMMDMELFYRTLSAISENTTVVLVGDYNQLPSVGPGLILRDLIDSKKIPATILKNVFRQSSGSEIITAANAVLDKDMSKINESFGKDFVFIEQTSKEEIYENISGCIKYLLSHGVKSEQIQLLTPQNEGLLGTTGLNNLMRDLCNPANVRGTGVLIHNTMFFPGDRIIQTENNNEKGIFNGSMGTIIRISDTEALAEFDGRNVILEKKDFASIKLGYAITVHKSQGSEFDFVFMPIVNEHEFTLNKNLVYTAITRAKKMFVVLGQKDVMGSTIEKEIVWDRKSQIKNKL
jgi:exodeoxyribonuclease V alpha subunit